MTHEHEHGHRHRPERDSEHAPGRESERAPVHDREHAPDRDHDNDIVIRVEGLTKVYSSGRNEVRALRGVDLTVRRGEMVAIMGASGSGKSTLMNILGCLDSPTSGTYELDGIRVDGLSKNELADIRNRKLGFVFQGFNLLPRTSALENVELPLLYDRTGRVKDTKAAAREALRRVGLAEREDHHPNELSGGQQQRVAIARALVTRPTLILADEPTGNLDTRTSIEVMALFQELNDVGITIVLVTHEPDIAQYAKRIVEVRDGRILRDEAVADQRRAAEDLRTLALDEADAPGEPGAAEEPDAPSEHVAVGEPEEAA